MFTLVEKDKIKHLYALGSISLNGTGKNNNYALHIRRISKLPLLIVHIVSNCYFQGQKRGMDKQLLDLASSHHGLYDDLASLSLLGKTTC